MWGALQIATGAARSARLRRRSLWSVLLTGTWLWLWLLLPTTAAAAAAPVTDYRGTWEYRYGDSPRTPDGQLLWAQPQHSDGGWQPIGNPQAPPGRHGARYLWLRTRLEGPPLVAPLLHITALDQSYEAYLDGQLIDHFGELGNGRFIGEPRVYLRLGADYRGKTLVLRAYSPSQYLGPWGALRIGEHTAVLYDVVSDGLPLFLAGVLFAFLGLIAFVLFLLRIKERIYLFYAGFMLGLGWHMVARSVLREFLFSWGAGWTYFELATNAISAASMCAFVAQAFGPGPFAMWRRLGIGMVCGLIISSLLVASGAIHIWTTLRPLQIYYMVILIAVFVLGIVEVRRRGRGGRVLALGLLTGSSIALFEMLMLLGLVPRYRLSLSHYAAGAFALSLGVYLAMRFVQTQRRLQNYTAMLQHSLALADSLEPGQQARTALDELLRMLEARRALLFQCDESGGLMRLTAGRDDKGHDLPDCKDFDAQLVENVQSGRKPLFVLQTAPGTQPRSIIAAPILMRDQMLGVLYLETDGVRRSFQKEDQDILLGLATQIASTLVSSRAVQLELERVLSARQIGEQDALLKAAARMAKGDLESAIVVPEKSELAPLAGALDGMRQDLRGMHDELRAKVHELEGRNQEIQQLNEELRRQIEQRSRRLLDMLLPKDEPLPPATQLQPGCRLGDYYRIVRIIGEGGMGVVYEVERTTDGRRLAAKVLSNNPDRTTVGRFAREAQILARLNHPNLISISDIERVGAVC